MALLALHTIFLGRPSIVRISGWAVGEVIQI